MDKQEIIIQLESITGDFLKSQGFVLVEFVCCLQQGAFSLRVLADKPNGGITMEDCGRLNFNLRGQLEAGRLSANDFTLELASPGLDRPLKNEIDFRRCLGKQAVFYLKEKLAESLEHKGLIKEVVGGNILIDQAGSVLKVPLEKIAKAKLIIK